MAAKGLKRTKSKKPKDGKSAQAYDHKEEKLLLRPDVGLQPQFKQKKPPMTYHYDPSLDPALSWGHQRRLLPWSLGLPSDQVPDRHP